MTSALNTSLFKCFPSQSLKSSRGIDNELAAFVLVICASGRARKSNKDDIKG